MSGVDEALFSDGFLLALDHDPAPGWQEVHHFCWVLARDRGLPVPRPDDVALWVKQRGLR